ncbi:GcrA family cell cycle regulator [Bosea sp. (in: a-proteobacteria)]|uniref:GcrA family cell cycle regulator n=1 Tax=Bosea sp. (in: a-proteobacteria) TaxID=1871050 RepID=UPI0027371BD5|nr:GcrA family cell cycle regulator [Bosea sp. (in: a-proteobacteria)]MDP3407259.1 GcrA family cell cycle regulator [Bosea sp. (in: a-proteobacteria)]
MNPPPLWTEERVARLKALLERGLSAGEIAEELGDVSRNAVIGKVHRLGLAFTRGWGMHETPAEAAARNLRPAPPRVPRPEKAAPAEPPVDPTPKAWPKPAGPEAVDIIGLKAGLCHMPLWGIEARSGLYCGKPVRAEGQRWCAACAQLVYERRPIRQQEELNAARSRRAKQLSRDGAFA